MTLFIAGLLLYHMHADWWWYFIALAVWGGHHYALTHVFGNGRSRSSLSNKKTISNA